MTPAGISAFRELLRIYFYYSGITDKMTMVGYCISKKFLGEISSNQYDVVLMTQELYTKMGDRLCSALIFIFSKMPIAQCAGTRQPQNDPQYRRKQNINGNKSKVAIKWRLKPPYCKDRYSQSYIEIVKIRVRTCG